MGMCSSTEEMQMETAHVAVDHAVAHTRKPTPAVRMDAEEWSPEYETRAVQLKVKAALQEKVQPQSAPQKCGSVSTSKIDPVLLALTLRSKRHVVEDDTPQFSARRLHAAENFLQKEQHILAGQLSMVKQRISKLAEETHSPRSARSRSHRDSTAAHEEANQSRSSSHDTDREASAFAANGSIINRTTPAESVVVNADRSSVCSKNDSSSLPSEIAVLC